MDSESQYGLDSPFEAEAPAVLWKYRGWNDYARSMIIDGELYFARHDELNDPFEFHWLERFPDDPEELTECVRLATKEHYPKLRKKPRKALIAKYAKELRSKADNASGSAVPTMLERPYHGTFCATSSFDDIRMWAYYAHSHQGVCIGVETSRSPRLFLPVIYQETMPIANVVDYIPKQNVMMNLSRIKAKVWEYEAEWRSCFTVGAHRFPECVSRVIIGARATDATRCEVLEAVSSAQHEIEVHEARINKSVYRLDFYPSIPASLGLTPDET